MRFIGKNLGKNDCVIVAAFNALSVIGSVKSYSEIKEIAKTKFGYTEEDGITGSETVESFLKHLDIKTKDVEDHDIEYITDKLLMGKTILLIYVPKGQKRGHMVMVTPENTKIKVINAIPEHPTWESFCNEAALGKIQFKAWELKKEAA